MRALLLVPLLLLLRAPSAAQASGYRFIIPEFTKVYEQKSIWGIYQFGMGYDHDFNDHLSMGFDAVIDLRRSTESGIDITVTSQGYEGHYIMADRLFDLKYRTAYAFAGNYSTSVYIGTFISYRSFKQVLELSYVTNNNPFGNYDNGPFQQHLGGSKALFPMGVRLGVRGTLDGGFADLYTELGYVAGGGASVFSQSYFTGEHFDLSSMSVTLGLAFGVGW